MPPLLTAREVCQRLRDAALGVLAFKLSETPAVAGLVAVDIEGWRLILDFEGGRLHHCLLCRSPDDRNWALNTSQHFGTDPVSLLSTWELAQIEMFLTKEKDGSKTFQQSN